MRCFVVCVSSVNGKTRWSSLHIVPDADLLGTGEFTVGFDGFIKKDTASVAFDFSFPVKFGITEWVNLDLAYASGDAGGMVIGIKGRILGETAKFMPSLAVGVHNLFNNKEASYFSVDTTDAKEMTGEIYCALSKSVEPIKTRFHLGIQTIPKSEKDKFNPYFAVEKYFGVGLYSSLEFYRRQKVFHLSLFANWRLLQNHLEISVGAVDLKSMFLDKNNKFSVSLEPADPEMFVKPGIWVGLKFHAAFGLGSNKGFMSVEDRMRHQDEIIETLVEEVDSINIRLKETLMVMDDVKKKMGIVIDSVVNDPLRIENIIYDKLTGLKALYASEPFDPEKVKLLIREIASYRDKAVPCLEELLLDIKVDRYIRMYSAALLGEIGNTASSDILLDVLARSKDPDIKIEILIALGKMKETRAMYLLEQLANSPNDAIAITAQEVLMRLSEVTGADISPDLRMRRITVDEERKLIKKTKSILPESFIAPDTGKAVVDTVAKDTMAQDTIAKDTSEAKDTIVVDKEEEKKKDVEGSKVSTVGIIKTKEGATSGIVEQTTGAEDIEQEKKEEEVKKEAEKKKSRKKRKDRKRDKKKDKEESKKKDKEGRKKKSREERKKEPKEDKGW